MLARPVIAAVTLVLDDTLFHPIRPTGPDACSGVSHENVVCATRTTLAVRLSHAPSDLTTALQPRRL